MKRVEIDSDARTELHDAVAYYERQRVGLGLEFKAEIERVLTLIREGPQRYPVIEGDELRQIIVRRFPYSVIYAELDEYIWVATFAHHKRKPGYWKKRKPE